MNVLSTSDRARIVACLVEGDWLVTVNDSPLNRSLFARHTVKPVVTRSGAVNKKKLPDATFGELSIQRKKERQVSFVTAPVKARRAA